jgi:alkanesulfonate monooxygenase SsuD/methylene tetrahydromethanopterin reductase-like flavin-dependent oxidoreductase (luciferase family)
MTVGEGKQRKRVHLAAHVSGGRLEFESLVHLARTAERGLFDFVSITDTFAVLSALAGMCERLGLVGVVDTAVDEPFGVSRRLATLDHLSDGRAGWSVHGSGDLDRARAEEFVTVARALLDSWEPDAVLADDLTGVYVDARRVHTVEHRGPRFDVRGAATLPAGPQGQPILLQVGDSREDGEFGAKHADALVVVHSSVEMGRRNYADVRSRAAAHGRDPDRLKVFNAVDVVLGDTAQDAADRARHLEPQRVPGRGQLVGTPEWIAAEMDSCVQSQACDGFALLPRLTPLDEFVDSVVPLLQKRGAFRTEYDGTTLRDHLGP